MALPVVKFASGGSDTAASGAGPATALSGTGNAHTGGVASTTITLPGGTDLSGVATDGSHVLWLKTASGRQFSKITAKDDGADTVTVEDSFTISAPGVDWAIGGKRATIENADSRTLFVATNGAKPGWIIELETDQTINTPITLAAAGSAAVGMITIRGAPAAGETVKITQTINDECFDGALNRWRIERIKFANSNATKTAANGIRVTAASGVHSIYRCIFGDATQRLNTGYSQSVNSAQCRIEDCEFLECVSNGIGLAAGGGVIVGCYVHDCDDAGIAVAVAGDYTVISGCIVARCAGLGGIAITAETNLVILNSTIDDNTGSGIYFSSGTVFGNNVIVGNQITNNDDYGIEVVTADVADYKKAVCDFNNFFGNTTGERLNISAGPNDLAMDPQYVDAANGNFEIGVNTKGEGFPDRARTVGANQSLSNSFVDIGAVQREEAAAGGAPFRRQLVR